MAEAAVDVVSLETMKRELRTSAGDNSQDARITEKIGEAVDYVSLVTGLPLLDATDSLYALPLDAHVRLALVGKNILEVTEVEFWEPTQELREEPTGQVAVNTLGRLYDMKEHGGFLLWPPEDGWPDRLQGSLFLVTVKRGIGEIAPGLKSAVILAARQLYEGFRDVKPTNALHTFLAPHRRYY